MEETRRLQSMGSLWVGRDWVTSLSHNGEGNGNPLQCSCLENPRDGRAWWAAVYGVAQSWTRLKRLSSSSKSRELCHLGPSFRQGINWLWTQVLGMASRGPSKRNVKPWCGFLSVSSSTLGSCEPSSGVLGICGTLLPSPFRQSWLAYGRPTSGPW